LKGREITFQIPVSRRCPGAGKKTGPGTPPPADDLQQTAVLSSSSLDRHMSEQPQADQVFDAVDT
jgi:hypothetical protein